MKRFFLLLVFVALAGVYIFALQRFWGPLPPLGHLLDPVDGLYYTARSSLQAPPAERSVNGIRDDVQLVRDRRGVPHIFADNELDASFALGYAVARDRLFQVDFISRVASGRLSEVLGPSLIETDRFLRRTGMDWGAEANLRRIQEQSGEEYDLIRAYVDGMNAYVRSMDPRDLPFEFRLLGYAPEPITDMHVIRVMQYMAYDLTYESNDEIYTALIDRLGPDSFRDLYPLYQTLYVPIIPERGGQILSQEKRPTFSQIRSSSHRSALPDSFRQAPIAMGALVEGFKEGKGSNNWVVGPGRSETGSPILAGDMHLSLWLPSIWYEAHMVTPSMNTYGVTIPGAPLIVEGYNDYVGWAFTNSGTDQIDQFRLKLDPSGRRYLFEGAYHDLEARIDTLHVKGQPAIVDTLFFSRWGPTRIDGTEAVSTRWVAHDSSRTLLALARMNTASSMDAFQEALTFWDTPMQNVVYGDVHGNIAIRSAGYLPIRRGGHGIGVLDGSTDAFEWIGRVPFDELPFSFNPPRGYLASTNQQPADSTYPHYQGYDWGASYRSLRIDALLSGKEQHTLEDLKRYQADIYVVQRDLFVPLLDSLSGLSERADHIRTLLSHWEGESDVDRVEPLVFELFLDHLNETIWDEAVFDGLKPPSESRSYAALTGALSPEWLDIQGTPEIEDAEAVFRHVLDKTVSTLDESYGWDKAGWRWGEHRKVVFKHYTRSEALKALWRGPYEYPGFEETLSPAADRETTHSASWRMVVDFSSQPPRGYGVYPGGQSGNPFSPLYDLHIDTYRAFDYYDLSKPGSPREMSDSDMRSTTRFSPIGAL